MAKSQKKLKKQPRGRAIKKIDLDKETLNLPDNSVKVYIDSAYKFRVLAQKTEKSNPIFSTNGTDKGEMLWNGENDVITLCSTDNERMADFFAARTTESQTAGEWEIRVYNRDTGEIKIVGKTTKLIPKDVKSTKTIEDGE